MSNENDPLDIGPSSPSQLGLGAFLFNKESFQQECDSTSTHDDNWEKRMFISSYILQYLTDNGYIESLIKQLNSCVKSNEDYEIIEKTQKSIIENARGSTSFPNKTGNKVGIANKELISEHFENDLKNIIDESANSLKGDIGTMCDNLMPLIKELINDDSPSKNSIDNIQIPNRYKIDYFPYLRKALANTPLIIDSDQMQCAHDNTIFHSNSKISTENFSFPDNNPHLSCIGLEKKGRTDSIPTLSVISSNSSPLVEHQKCSKK